MIAWIGLEADMESKKKKISVNWALYLMLVPGFLYMLFNNYIPMTFTVIAFKKFNFQKGIWGSADAISVQAADRRGAEPAD